MDCSVNVMKICVEGNGGDTFTGSGSNRPYIITTTGHGGQPLDFGTNNVKRMELTNTGLVPAANDTYNLGTNTNKWADIYVTNFKTTSTGFEAAGTEFKFSDTADTNVIINADTDNHDEAHHPSLSFKQDGAVHVLDIGVNGSGPDYTGGTHNFAYVKVGGHANVGLDIATSGSAGNAPTKRLTIDHNGHIIPGADSTYNIGTNTNRFANIYADTLYGDGSNLTGISSVGGSTGVDFNDNVKARFGNSNDLEIYHGVNHSYIIDNGTGDLKLRGSEAVKIEDTSSGKPMITCTKNFGTEIYHQMNSAVATAEVKFATTSTGVTITGHALPASNNAHDLGSTSLRWRNVYTNDLHLSNEGSSNDVDSTWGDWTIQEGESDLFLKNNRSGKKYKFNLTEVS